MSERIKAKRAKCLPPKGLRGRWCGPLEASLSADTHRGIWEYVPMIFATGKLVLRGIATRMGEKKTARPILFSVCPFCGAPIFFGEKPGQ